jgi:hypothetical protein
MSQPRVPKYIPGFRNSYILPSPQQPADIAIIFVHGFGGKPTSTWINFHGLVDEYSPDYPLFAIADLFFYSYESLHTPILRNADILRDFANQVLFANSLDMPSAVQSSIYKSLIFAGHSEGGVIIRQLVLNQYQQIRNELQTRDPKAATRVISTAIRKRLESDFLLSASLRLFAPACRGTNFSSWTGFLTSLSTFVLAITSSFLVRNELLPTSPILQDLKNATEKAHTAFPAVRALYAEPIFGVPDQIVVSASYEGEKLWWDIGWDHFSVCKPAYNHKRPLEFVGE